MGEVAGRTWASISRVLIRPWWTIGTCSIHGNLSVGRSSA